MKRFILVFAIGGLIGTVIASWIAPAFLVWWWTPPTDLPLSCRKAVGWTARGLLIGQVVGLSLGAFLALLIYYGFIDKRKKRPELSKSLDIED